MKKLILVLAIALIASPAFALDVALVRNGSNIDVVYTGNGATASTRARAFALDLTVASGPLTFTGLVGGSYKQGESTSAAKGYGIYPAKISVDSAGSVSSWGTPDACSTDPAPGTGFGSSHIVLEFGSLYYADTNAPGASGTLCTLTVTSASTSVITMTDELTYRGGIVYEDGSQDLTAGDKSFTYTVATLPSPATNGLPTPNVTTATGGLTTDLSWTAGAGATSYDVYFGTVLPGSPASVTGTTFDTGTMVQGKTYLARVVSRNASGVSAPLDWSFNTDCVKSSDGGYAYWVLCGKPSCWCYRRQCKGDGNGQMSASKPVIASDLTNFQAGFNLKYTQMINKVDGAGVPTLCGDYNHSASASKPVIASDLTIFQANFNLKYTSIPECPSTNMYFFTN